MSGIRAVFFDVGSTLIYPYPSVEQVFCEVAATRGHTVDVHHAASFMPQIDEFYEREYGKNGDFWCSPEGSVEIWLQMYEYLAYLLGLEHDARALAEQVNNEFSQPQRWKTYDDVRPCLMSLKKNGLRLGVISNWDPSLRSLLRGLGLAPFFEEIISSADVGYRKPDAVIFQLMSERLSIHPNACVHVGDLPEADGMGAASAGMKPMIIDRNNRFPKTSYDRIASLEDLCQRILAL